MVVVGWWKYIFIVMAQWRLVYWKPYKMSLKGVNEKMAWENKNFRKIGGMLGNEMGALEKERGL